MASAAATSSKGRFAFPLLLLLAVVAAYAASLNSPFLFDDADAVVENTSIRKVASWRIFSPPQDGTTTSGRPLVNASYALNYAWTGTRPWSYHAVNVALHGCAALLAFGLLRRTFQSVPLASRVGPRATGLAFAAALLWAVHPLLSETVIGIAQRTELLCALACLAALYAFVRSTEPGARAKGWAASAVAASAAAMASKEVAVALPVLVFLYDRTFLAGSFSTAWKLRRGVHLAIAATWLLLAWLVWMSGGTRGDAAGLGLGVSSWSYLLRQCEALVLYLRLAAVPYPLVVDYGSGVVSSWTEVIVPGAAVLLLLTGTAWALVKRPALGFVGAWFFVLLAPSSSFVPLVTQTVAEHRMYLPLLGLVALASVLIGPRLGRASIGVLPLLAVAAIAGTISRSRDYRSPLALYASAVAHCPGSARAQNNLGVALQEAGRLAEADPHFAEAVALDPAYDDAWYNWGSGLLEQGKPHEALAPLQRAVSLRPRSTRAWVVLGDAQLQAGQTEDAAHAYETALRLQPDTPALEQRLGLILLRRGRLAEAEIRFTAALRARPGQPDVLSLLGNVQLLQGKFAEAEATLAKAYEARPDEKNREALQRAIEARRAAGGTP